MFSFERRLRFGDCDPSGIAYFPAYLNMLNGVVEDFWARIGFPWTEIIVNRKIGTPTVHLTCDFSQPSFFGDLLTFRLEVARVGRKSLHLSHAVVAGDKLRWKAGQIIVATSTESHLSIDWPDDVRRALLAFSETDGAIATV